MAQRAFDLVVFDFDGTLADSAAWMTRTLPRICDEFGLTRLDADEIEKLRGQSSREILRHMHIPPWKLPAIAARMRKLSADEAASIPLFEGAPDLLATLKARGFSLGVASSNSVVTIREVLGPGPAGQIDFFECAIELFGKAARLRRIARVAGIPPQRAIYIGDETRDIEAAKLAGFGSGAVLWGYATSEAPPGLSPMHSFCSIEDLTCEGGERECSPLQACAAFGCVAHLRRAASNSQIRGAGAAISAGPGGAHVGAGELSGSSSSSSRFRPSRSSIQPSNARERRTRSAPRSSA